MSHHGKYTCKCFFSISKNHCQDYKKNLRKSVRSLSFPFLTSMPLFLREKENPGRTKSKVSSDDSWFFVCGWAWYHFINLIKWDNVERCFMWCQCSINISQSVCVIWTSVRSFHVFSASWPFDRSFLLPAMISSTRQTLIHYSSHSYNLFHQTSAHSIACPHCSPHTHFS